MSGSVEIIVYPGSQRRGLRARQGCALGTDLDWECMTLLFRLSFFSTSVANRCALLWIRVRRAASILQGDLGQASTRAPFEPRIAGHKISMGDAIIMQVGVLFYSLSNFFLAGRAFVLTLEHYPALSPEIEP